MLMTENPRSQGKDKMNEYSRDEPGQAEATTSRLEEEREELALPKPRYQWEPVSPRQGPVRRMLGEHRAHRGAAGSRGGREDYKGLPVCSFLQLLSFCLYPLIHQNNLEASWQGNLGRAVLSGSAARGRRETA